MGYQKHNTLSVQTIDVMPEVGVPEPSPLTDLLAKPSRLGADVTPAPVKSAPGWPDLSWDDLRMRALADLDYLDQRVPKMGLTAGLPSRSGFDPYAESDPNDPGFLCDCGNWNCMFSRRPSR